MKVYLIRNIIFVHKITGNNLNNNISDIIATFLLSVYTPSQL
jgi:hypothetical protein